MAKILIVDDSSFMRNIIKNVLIDNGHIVVGEAENGIQALDKYKQLKPDLVTMDITLPDKDGIEVVKDIINYDSNARVIMCSAMGQQTFVINSIQAGAKDFIVKPFSSLHLINTVGNVLNKFN